MHFLGIPLSKPTFNEFTASAVMAAGLWLVGVALMSASHQPLDRVEAGGALLIVFWGCVGARIGIRIERGARHLVANLVCGAVLLATYQGIVTALA